MGESCCEEFNKIATALHGTTKCVDSIVCPEARIGPHGEVRLEQGYSCFHYVSQAKGSEASKD